MNPNDGLSILVRDVLSILSQLQDQSETVFKHVAPFNNQIERFGSSNDFDINNRPINVNVPFDFPAAFVEVIVDNVQPLSGTWQQVSGRLIIHVALYDYDLFENHLKPYAMRFRVHQALHLLKDITDRYELRRQNEIVSRSYSNLYDYQLVYQFTLTDNTVETQFSLFGTNGISFENQTEVGNI